MHIALDNLVYFVRYRQGHVKILPYGIENVSFFSHQRAVDFIFTA